MKTPMQELYEKMFNEMQPNHPVGYNVVFGIAADMVKDMLEKEKEAMCEFAFRFNHDAFNENYIKAEFEETFNTKEK